MHAIKLISESLVMTKVHKDIALFMVQLSESELTEEQIIKALSDRTKELLNQLRFLKFIYIIIQVSS
jgi:hypothetical protein